MFVRAAPQSASIWTKPQDLVFDSEKPFTGEGNHQGRFAAALADGSCRWLNIGSGKETMRALATRAGGEYIDWDKLH